MDCGKVLTMRSSLEVLLNRPANNSAVERKRRPGKEISNISLVSFEMCSPTTTTTTNKTDNERRCLIRLMCKISI
jgi:hypothetical protein